MRIIYRKYMVTSHQLQHFTVAVLTICGTFSLIVNFDYMPLIASESDLNKSLVTTKVCERMNLNVFYPKPSIVTSFGHGRTGNQLCYFATGYSLWRDYGILNFLAKRQIDMLENIFVLPKLDEESDNSPYYAWREGMCFTNPALNI